MVPPLVATICILFMTFVIVDAVQEFTIREDCTDDARAEFFAEIGFVIIETDPSGPTEGRISAERYDEFSRAVSNFQTVTETCPEVTLLFP